MCEFEERRQRAHTHIDTHTHHTPSENSHRLGVLQRFHHDVGVTQQSVLQITLLPLPTTGMIGFRHAQKRLFVEQSIHAILRERIGVHSIHGGYKS